MRLYLDTCSLNRPWDDQSQGRIHLEAEAVIYIIDAARRGSEEIVSSDYLLAEIQQITDPVRRADVFALLDPATLHVSQHPSIDTRVHTLPLGASKAMMPCTSAAAEAAHCDYFLTTDDRLIRRSTRAGPAIRMKILNPFDYPPSSFA